MGSLCDQYGYNQLNHPSRIKRLKIDIIKLNIIIRIKDLDISPQSVK